MTELQDIEFGNIEEAEGAEQEASQVVARASGAVTSPEACAARPSTATSVARALFATIWEPQSVRERGRGHPHGRKSRPCYSCFI